MIRWSDSKISKIWFSILNQKIKRPIKYSDSSGRAYQLMTRATISGISLQSCLLCLPTELIRYQSQLLWIIFVCFVDGYVTANLYYYLLEVSVDISQEYNTAHIYTLTRTRILTYTHPHTPCLISTLRSHSNL